MSERTYDASDIQVIEFDEHVRRKPGMYFGGSGRTSPKLATEVLCAVLRHALHPATRVAPEHTLRVEAVIWGDLAFSVTDDRADALDGQGRPRLGHYGSMLGPDRWLSAAAAALSSRTVVEIWQAGRGFRQELAGIRPAGEPQEFTPGTGAGTRVVFELDETYLEPGTTITANLGSLDLHGSLCAEPDGPGYVVLRDLRDPDGITVNRYR